MLDAVASRHAISLSYTEFDWSCRRYEHEGAMMPADGIDTLRGFDAILLAAIEATLAKPETRTGDLGGTAPTVEVTEALVAHF